MAGELSPSNRLSSAFNVSPASGSATPMFEDHGLSQQYPGQPLAILWRLS